MHCRAGVEQQPNGHGWPLTVVIGAAAGVIATGFMSVLMLAAGRLGLMGKQPPEAIAERLLGWTSRLPWRERESNIAGSIAHLAFGAMAGIGFAWARQVVPGANRPGAGVVYALGIWASAYLGWVPALRILPRADRDRPGRPLIMIAAHLIYGAVLGLLTRGVSRVTRV